DPEAHRCIRLVDDHRGADDAIERQALARDGLGHRLDQIERPLPDDAPDTLGDVAVVGRRVDAVIADVDLEVEVHDERLRRVLLPRARTVTTFHLDAGQEHPRAHAFGPTSCPEGSGTVDPSASSPSPGTRSTHPGRRSSWSVVIPPWSCGARR